MSWYSRNRNTLISRATFYIYTINWLLNVHFFSPELLRFRTGPELLRFRAGINEKKRTKEKSSQKKTTKTRPNPGS
ncbi:hypothetical protein Q4534_23850 [Cyclobacterium sp. 1_MG-2023]|nr:hypothetical protein [Cyclobacterium sp. 1_MG-2023]